jgi:hypothetical protein
MARKGWGSLSPAYRARLEKAGITQKEYGEGKSLQGARGHSATPERPGQYSPQKYPQYHTERQRLITELEERKRQLWGDRPRWDAQKASLNIRSYPPTMSQLRWAVDEADDGEILDEISEAPEEFAWLGYH